MTDNIPDWLSFEDTDCPSCGLDRYSVAFVSKDNWGNAVGAKDVEFRYVRCAGCSLVYLNPRPTTMSIGRFYGSEYVSHGAGAELGNSHVSPVREVMGRKIFSLGAVIREWLFMNSWGGAGSFGGFAKRALLRLFKKSSSTKCNPMAFSGKGMVSLDIGCGLGGFTREMQDHGWKAFGLDINGEAVSKASNSMGVPSVVSDVSDIPFRNGAVDFVSMNQSLEHMYNPQKTIREAARALKTNGTLFVNVPNGAGLTARIFGKYWIGTDAPRHLTLWSKETLSPFLENEGFKINWVYYVSSTESISAAVEFALRGIGIAIRKDSIRKNRIMNYVVKPLVRLLDMFGSGENVYIVATKTK